MPPTLTKTVVSEKIEQLFLRPHEYETLDFRNCVARWPAQVKDSISSVSWRAKKELQR